MSGTANRKRISGFSPKPGSSLKAFYGKQQRKHGKNMMLHEIAPHRLDNQYRQQPPTAESYGLCYDSNTVLVRGGVDGFFDLPTFGELETHDANACSASTYLFSMGDRTFYWLHQAISPPGFTWKAVRETMRSNPRDLAFAAVTGYQLANWYESRKFCGRCGTPTIRDEKLRCLCCPQCKQVEYPKIAPAVIVGVTDGNRLLLARYPHYDKYALLAGFVEIGEALEETVRREVMEEAGLRVKNIRYYKSQPWPIADNLLAGFFCDLDGSDSITIDAEELSSAQWFDREAIPVDDDNANGSLTHEMIRQFKNGTV